MKNDNNRNCRCYRCCRTTNVRMLKTSDLFADLPDKYHDSAFLDRIHCFNPGWEVENLRSEMFSQGYGFVVDYFAEILRALRNEDYSSEFSKYFTLGEEISTRDKDGIKKTFSGLMKIIFPNNDATEDETKELLMVAMEGRKRVKDQLLRIDTTFDKTKFVFFRKGEQTKELPVQTLEEIEFKDIYYHDSIQDNQTTQVVALTKTQEQIAQLSENVVQASSNSNDLHLKEGHKEIKENQKGGFYYEKEKCSKHGNGSDDGSRRTSNECVGSTRSES